MRDAHCRADRRNRKWKSKVLIMLSWVVTFLVIALIAGILGFGGIAGASVEIAKTIFFIAVVLFLISAVVGLARGRTRLGRQTVISRASRLFCRCPRGGRPICGRSPRRRCGRECRMGAPRFFAPSCRCEWSYFPRWRTASLRWRGAVP